MQNTDYCINVFGSFSPFVKAGAVFSYFTTDGNLECWTGALKLECKKSANIHTFYLRNFVGISVSWNVLDASKFRTFLKYFFLIYFRKREKFVVYLSKFCSHGEYKLNDSHILQLVLQLDQHYFNNWSYYHYVQEFQN